MNKILPIILVVVLSGCAASQSSLVKNVSKSDINEEYFINKYLKNKTLENIEGIWRYKRFGTSAYSTMRSKFHILIIKNPEESGSEYIGVVSKGSYCATGVGDKIFDFDRDLERGVYTGIGHYDPPACTSSSAVTEFIHKGNTISLNMAWPFKVTLTKIYPYTETVEADLSNKISGTGFFINSNGHIVTNHHVIENCSNISVLKNNQSTKTKLIAKDESLDLALLSIDSKNNSFIPITKLPIEKLQRIIAAGYPFGKYLNDDLKVTSGIVSSLKGPGDDSSLFQMDAALNFGNSGGPIVDEETGNLIGVAVGIIRNENVEGINYAIKNSSLINFLQSNLIPFEANATESKISRKQLSDTLENSTVYITCH